VNLTVAPTDTDGTTLTFTLTEVQRAAALAISGTTGGDGGAVVLDVDALGVTDMATNTNLIDDNNTVTETADSVAPTVTAADITSADGKYIAYNNVDITLTFSEAATITGTPRILLNTTNGSRYANYLSGSGTTDIVFRYAVQPGDLSSDLGADSTGALGLNSGTILDAASNAATLTLPNTMVAANAVLVDGVDHGGGGGGAGATPSSTPTTPVTPADTTTTPATDTTTTTTTTTTTGTTTTTTTTPAPVSVLIHDPSQLENLLAAMGTSSKPSDVAKYKPLVKSDAIAFKVGLTAAQTDAVTNFIVYSASPETAKLGAGERRALMRDYLETVARPNVVWDDVQRLATGQKPVKRNLPKEQAQVTRALANFKLMVGHAPNFKDAKEDLAWNTLMYRIRFTRDLKKEQSGILQFKKLYSRAPSTPMEWAIVRGLGYALQK